MRKCWSPPPESLPKSHCYFIRASSPSKTGKNPVSPLIDRCQHHQQDCKRNFLRTLHFAPTNEQPSANCITQKTRQMRDDSWGAFKRNTEAGRLLSRLYGVEGDVSSQIKYPKLKTKPKTRNNTQDHRAEHENQWRAVGAPGIRDPKEKRYDRARASRLPVPKVSKQQVNHVPAVDAIPRRRSATSCNFQISEGRQNRRAYRPPHQNKVHSKAENMDGGRALPRDLSQPAPAKGKGKRNARKDATLSPEEAKAKLFDQIANEIKERRQWQTSMEEIGAGAKTRRKVAEEISGRMQELLNLNPKKSKALLLKLNEN